MNCMIRNEYKTINVCFFYVIEQKYEMANMLHETSAK